jgi:hypothetical protein
MKKRKNINEVVNKTIEEFDVKVNCKLGTILDEVGLSIRELSLLTGIRYASVNELVNNKKVTLNLQHVLAIMVALRITDFNQLFELEFEDVNEHDVYRNEAFQIHDKGAGLPDSVFDKIKANAVELEREDELKKH